MSIVVVGAGQAGAWVARSARDAGYAGPITLIGNERHWPYERPPLSKDVLYQARAADIPLFPEADYKRLGINVVLDTRVTSIDLLTRSVTCGDGSSHRYERLALTTGGRARRPVFPGSELPGVFTLRSFEDATAIAARLRVGGHLLVLGGGWIGLEVAAAARRCGMNVTLLESGDRLCARSVSPQLSTFLYDKHTQEGIDICLQTSILSLSEAADGRLEAIVTPAGSDPKLVDLVVLGVGLQPNVELAAAAGLAVDDGVLVDEHGRTSDSRVYAAGDVARQPCSWACGRLRIESWANARDQGAAVGRALAGKGSPYDELPWFWSDQYDLNVQMVGIFRPNAEEVVRGDLKSRKFMVFQVIEGRVIAAASVNSVRELKHAKQLIKRGTRVKVEALRDPDVALSKLLA